MPQIKKILIVSPSFNIGGIERSLSNLANYFSSQHILVQFVSLHAGEIFFELNNSIDVVAPTFKRKGNIFKLIFYRIRLVFFLRSQIINFQPDIVFSLSDTFNSIALLANIGTGKKIVIGDVTKPDRQFKLSTRLAKKYLYPISSGFVAQTNAAAEYYRNKFKNRLNITVINGAVKEVELHAIEREKLIIVVGRLSVEKGQDRMLDIFERVKNKEGWKLAFTADGPLKKTLLENIENKNMSAYTVLLGRVNDLDKLYAQASIFAMPSRLEGFPNALCEAMAAGLPCICFDSFPADEIITDGVDGFIVKDGNLDDFAIQIDKLIESDELRKNIGRKAMEIRNRLSIDKIGNEFLGFFKTTI